MRAPQLTDAVLSALARPGDDPGSRSRGAVGASGAQAGSRQRKQTVILVGKTMLNVCERSASGIEEYPRHVLRLWHRHIHIIQGSEASIPLL